MGNEVRPLVLQPGFKAYAWGDRNFIPKLFGFAATEQPCAEAWFGAHRDMPSTAQLAGDEVPLDQLVAKSPAQVLGPRVQGRFNELPYLVKILAAAQPLSIQVHPSRAQAIAGFRRDSSLAKEQRSYHDPNPKPELIVALTRFDALCGFRPIEEIGAALAGAPDVAGLLPAWRGTPESLHEVLAAYFALPEAAASAALARWLQRLGDAKPAADTHEHWVLEAHRLFSRPGRPDRGLFLIPLLNLIALDPWQALYLPAGVPHSYLRGAGVEVMANSDNVLRAGLTPKNVDPGALLSLLRFDCGRPHILQPTATAAADVYTTPAEEFEVARLAVGPRAAPSGDRTADGPELLLFLSERKDARLQVSSATAPAIELANAGACLVPDGATYRVSSGDAGTVVRVSVPDAAETTDFRGTHPRRLAFGTSGLRALVTEITDLEAYINARGFLDYLVEIDDASPGAAVVLGGDLRPSTDGPERSILNAVARAVVDAGFRPVNYGKQPTPALAHFAFKKKLPSIIVTGSHIPFDRNGIKFNKSGGEVLKLDEEPILRAVDRVRRDEYGRPAAWSLFDDQGGFRAGLPRALPAATPDAEVAYKRRYLDFFPPAAVAGMRVVVYQHSAVGRDVVVDVLRGFGAEVFPMGRTDTFIAIDTEAITEQRLQELQAIAKQALAQFGAVDAIVSTDGDSDRPLVVAVERSGRLRFIGGDMLGIMVADYLGADAIAVPVTATDAIDLTFVPKGVQPIRTRVGSPWVIAAMAQAPGRRRVGWEANGGFLTFSDIERNGRIISALPTRDALLPILSVLHACQERHTSLGAMLDALPQRPGRSALLDGVSPEASRALMAHFALPDATLMRARLERHFDAKHGFGEITDIDLQDGIRISFANGDVAHVRGSGNAPQLRIYAVAGSESRADEIVAAGVREPDGILRAMLADAAKIGG